MTALRSCSLALSLVLLPVSAVAEDSPEPAPSPAAILEAAHKGGDRAHVLGALRVDSAIESLNSGEVQVFGTRREYRCPGGGQVSESACAPCTYAAKAWAERPTEQWIVDFSWAVGDEAEHAAALAQIEHFRRFFDLRARPGVEKGGRRYTFFELAGPRAVPDENPEISTLRLHVGGKEAALALIPVGEKDVEIEAKAWRRAGSGAPVAVADPEVAFESTCAQLTQAGPKVRAALTPGVERCEVKALARKGGASASVIVRRELQLFVTYEEQRVDDLVLEGALVVELGFEAATSGKPAQVTPKWVASSGKLELLDGGKRVRLRLDPQQKESLLTLSDEASGASAQARIRRKVAK